MGTHALEQTTRWLSRVEITRLDQPQAWRLLTGPTEDNTMEEMVFTVIGVVCGLDLPPILKRPA